MWFIDTIFVLNLFSLTYCSWKWGYWTGFSQGHENKETKRLARLVALGRVAAYC